jgi:hypothetical protein
VSNELRVTNDLNDAYRFCGIQLLALVANHAEVLAQTPLWPDITDAIAELEHCLSRYRAMMVENYGDGPQCGEPECIRAYIEHGIVREGHV